MLKFVGRCLAFAQIIKWCPIAEVLKYLLSFDDHHFKNLNCCFSFLVHDWYQFRLFKTSIPLTKPTHCG